MAAALATVSVGGAQAAEMTLVNFGGANGNAQKAAYIEPFQKTTGTKVVVVEYNGELAKLKAMVETGKVSWDVVEIESGLIGRACEEGLLEKLDYSKIGKKSDFMQEAVQECGMGAFVWSTVLAYNGRIDSAQREGKNLKVTWGGSIYDLDYWVIPKGTPNKALAEKFIAFASTPESQKNYAGNIAYGPVNHNALKLLDAKTLADLPTSANNAKDAVQQNLQFWTDHGEDLEQRFTAWAAK